MELVGLCTDDNIFSYCRSRAFPYIDVRTATEDAEEFSHTEREYLEELVDGEVKEDELVLGGSSIYHHFTLGMMDALYPSCDVVNIDQHADTARPKWSDVVTCANHLFYALEDDRNLLIVNTHKGSSNYTLKPGAGNGKPQTLEEGLEELTSGIFLTIDIDVLSDEEFVLRDKRMQEAGYSYGQGTMSLENLLSHVEKIVGNRDVLGASVFGMCDDRETFDIYDAIVEELAEL